MMKLKALMSSLAPLAIIAGLLYAGLFIKPAPPVSNMSSAAIGLRDSFYGVAVPSPKVVWAVGRDGKVVRSDDAGRVWTVQATGSIENLQAIAAWSDAEAIVVGNSSTVLMTADGGRHWNSVAGIHKQGEAQKFIRVRLLGDHSAMLVGEFGAMLASSDKGATWRTLGKVEDVAWHDAAEPADKMLVVVGEFGRIRRSIDAGLSWTAVASPVKTTLTAVRFRDANNGVAVGLDGVVLATSDGGQSWKSQASPTRDHLFDVSLQGDDWLAVGDKGVMLRGTPDGNWTGGRISDTSYAWHTQVLPANGSIYLAGAQLARLDADRKLTRF